MVTQITLGTFFNANGRNVLGGVGGSGLDTQSLIESLVLAKSTPAILLQQQVSKNQGIISKLQDFQKLVANFQSIANSLRNPPGVLNAADNAFSYNSVSLTSNTSVTAGTYLSVNAAPGASLQNYSITYISSLAAATKQLTDSFAIASATTTGLVTTGVPSSGQFKAGTFTVNGASITLDENDTLSSIAQKFNSVANQSEVLASVVQVASGEYRLSFTGIETGADFAFDLDDSGTVDDPDGVLDQIVFNTTQTASDAKFVLDGVEITRSTNTISDVIDGLTFTLLQVTPDDPENPPATPTTITVSVQADNTTAKNSIVALANAYNELKVFEAKQLQSNTDGTYASDSILATNQTFRNTMSLITRQISSVVSGLTDGDPNNLADLGITFTTSPASSDTPEVRNVLTIDEVKFAAALASDFNAVRDLFQFTLTSDSVNLKSFSRTNALGVNDFTLDLNPYASQVTGSISVADADTQIAFTSPASGQFGEGDIIINGVTISIADGDTLNSIAQKFNDEVANTGLAAAVTEVNPGEFTLTFTATPQAGKTNKFDLTDSTINASDVFGDIDITATGTFQATYDLGAGDVTIDLEGTLITGGGGFLLKGEDGTVFEGLQLVYSNTAAKTISASITQGLGDLLYNTADATTDPVDGSISLDISTIAESDDRLTDQIERINDQVSQFRDQLLLKFAALEQAISRVNQLLNTLSAQDQARQQFYS